MRTVRLCDDAPDTTDVRYRLMSQHHRLAYTVDVRVPDTTCCVAVADLNDDRLGWFWCWLPVANTIRVRMMLRNVLGAVAFTNLMRLGFVNGTVRLANVVMLVGNSTVRLAGRLVLRFLYRTVRLAHDYANGLIVNVAGPYVAVTPLFTTVL